MAVLANVSYEVFARQARDLIRLQAWYVWHLAQRRGMGQDEIFGRPLVDFWCRRERFDDEARWEEWLDARREILEACRAHGDHPDTAALEQWVLARVTRFVDEPYLRGVYTRVFEKNFRDASPFFGFSYQVKATPEAKLALHFTNCVVPESPFSYPEELRAGLRRLLAQAVAERHDVTEVTCWSWLNSLRPFTDLFPPSWLASRQAGPLDGSFGWWGQFTDRTGAMHRGNEEYLRRTGEFRFKFAGCRCAVAELADHLAL